MAKKLIITEKPSVAYDFARVLGVNGRKTGYIENDEYVISWCVGHLVEMLYPEAYDEKYKKWRTEDLPFLPEEYKYGVIDSVKQQYDIVHSLLHREDISVVYWAGDSGKEGQTIEENIRKFGGVRNGMTELRVWIDSQTDEEIRRGINEAKPMSDYDNLGKSGIMRTIEDYALGINFSRVLSVKYGKLLNDAAATKSYTAIAVGRVMTCVLGMIVIREREIRDFTETPFYRVIGNFTDRKIPGEWKAVEHSKYFNSPYLYKENGFKKEEYANALIEELSGEKAYISSSEQSITRKKAPLLFNLAELQAECAKIFKISPDETLQVVQELYERKLTTYPRTDARVLSTAVAKEISKNLYKLKEYMPTKAFVDRILEQRLYTRLASTMYADDSKITDHYAIIPTGQTNGLNGLSKLHNDVFDLITRRFLSIFYPPAEYTTIKITVEIKNEQFTSNAKILKSPGYMEISGIPKNNDSEEENEGQKQALLELASQMKQGDEIPIDSFSIKEGKTSPPKRYTSGTIILAMENAGNLIEDEELRAQIRNTGIGTSATRAEIIKKLIKIGYIHLNTKTQVLTPENLGEMIFEVVNMSVPSLLNPKMTASWEKGLEGIVSGSVIMEEYRAKLEDYIRSETLAMIDSDLTDNIARQINRFTGKDSKGIATRRPLGLPCPVCGGELTTTSFGYGCSNYWNKENGCKFNVGTIAGVSLSEEIFRELITTGKTAVLDGFVSKNKKKFSASLLLQKDGEGKVQVTFGDFQSEPEIIPDVKCPACGGTLQVKSFGYGCTNYNPEDPASCKFAIGKIAGKDLSISNVKELLLNQKTQTIRGFKSKAGKKFDACLTLVKEEGALPRIAFDFEEVEAKVIKDVKCPVCGGDIVKNSFGYGCASYERDNPDSCKFSIGKMASKDLTEAQVKELLANGVTSTIYGFKSKTGKKFDARIALSKDEEGKITGLKFDFDNLEEKRVKDVKCPACEGDIVVTPYGYRCINNVRDKEDACSFHIGKISSVSLTEKQVKQLLTEGKTEVIDKFVAKTGMIFSAALKLTDENRVAFDFGEGETVVTELICPACGAKLNKNLKQYFCGCGLRFFKSIAGHEIKDETMDVLLKKKRTPEKIQGFTSKSGNLFDAYLELNEENKIVFSFEDRPATPSEDTISHS
ncbi:MAG: topoisomerase C-terminal repeat-containing protein [Lachnospiraceae bacterium]|nr:topoisomerase C-terminal repeat-containing protein [Lachnospiraceae bacterium]